MYLGVKCCEFIYNQRLHRDFRTQTFFSKFLRHNPESCSRHLGDIINVRIIPDRVRMNTESVSGCKTLTCYSVRLSIQEIHLLVFRIGF